VIRGVRQQRTQLTNPYESPIESSDPGRVRVSPTLRVLAIVSFACGFFAFLANYGYPAWMSHQWYFIYLPILAAISILSAGISFVLPYCPSSRRTFAWLPALTCFLTVILCFLTAAALDFVSPTAVWALTPRILLWCLALISAMVIAMLSHGTSRGRRLASVGFAFGILQTVTSIVDTMYTEYDT